MNSISVGSEVFKVSKATRKISDLSKPLNRTIWDCYSRPSETKVSIYNRWLQWATENSVEYFGIASYNSNIFTLQGVLVIDDKEYIVHITPSYNTLYPVQR